GRLHEDMVEILRALLELRLGLENDLVIVCTRIDGRALPRAECVIELRAHMIARAAIDRRLLAIDLDRHLWILYVEIGRDIKQSGDLSDLVAQFGPNAIEAVGIVGLQRVLILTLVQSPTEIDVLDRLKEDLDSWNDIHVLTQPRHDLSPAFAFVARLESNQHAPAVADRIRTARSDRRIDVSDAFIGTHELGNLALMLRHCRKR